MTVFNCYNSPEEKRRNFPTVTIPLIFEMAWAGRDVVEDWLTAYGIEDIPSGVPQLAAIHNLTRQGRYRSPSQTNCDPPQAVGITIRTGGDCDQWASVLIAGLWVLGFTPVLITFGDNQDSFQHVAVATYWRLSWFLLDPKGDGVGLDFNDWNNGYGDFKLWQANEFGY